MVVVKVKTVRGTTEVFSTETYIVGKREDLHPDILDVKVYAGSRCIKHQTRHFQKFYIKHLYRPLPVEQIQQTQQNNEEQKFELIKEPKKNTKPATKKATTSKSKTKKKE